jgi:predicted amidohydrolase YtcJ
MRPLRPSLGVVALLAIASTPAVGQSADTVLYNGKVVTLAKGSPMAQAVAVRDGRIIGVGAASDVRKLAGPKTKMIDLGGRTVIPGLIDSHVHAIRAALFYASEVNWVGTRSIPEAMERIKEAAKRKKPGEWLIVAGGWTEQQFAERRRPTEAELIAAAPDNPVYVQLFYSHVLLTPAGRRALGITSDADLPPNTTAEAGVDAKPTGWYGGNIQSISAFFSKLPLPTQAQKAEGTRQFFRELNRLGITGVVDPAGFNMPPAEYQPLFDVWQAGDLTVRVAYSIFAQRRGKELEDFQTLTQLLPQGAGDAMLKFNGIGEAVTWGMYNNDSPTDAQKEELYQAAKWAASRRMTLTHHWQNGKSAGHLLDVFERVDKEIPIAPLRWSIAHLNVAPPGVFPRMKALGVGWTMQNAMYFDSAAFTTLHGKDALRLAPPVKTALKAGVNVGAGTDAHRVMSYNPMAALQWMVDGKTVAGEPTRAAEEILTREEALRLYTIGSAWFAHDEVKRGSIEAGKLADLAVLTKDYMTVPAEEIGRLESVLTMVGGKIVYAAGPFAKTEAAKTADAR